MPKTHNPDSNDQASVALRTVLSIFDRWRLSEAQAAKVLGDVPLTSLRLWEQQLASDERAEVQLTETQWLRISYVLSIHKALRVLFSDGDQADGWIQRPNTARGFDGRPALDLMLQSDIAGLQFVRRYLDGVCAN